MVDRNGTPLALEVQDLSKHFGGVEALEGLDLAVAHGEVVALVGDNGAGKSTFMKLVSGAHAPTRGTIRVDGEVVQVESPAAGRTLGIETVYQDTGLVDVMDLASNFFLGRELLHPNPILRFFGQINRKEMHARAHDAITEVGVTYTGTPRKPVGLLSGGQRAAILTGRAAHFGSKLLLMDEPTAALGVEQSKHVLEIIKRVAANGLGTIIVSHNLDEVFAVADRIVVLRLGRKAVDLQTTETDGEEIVAYITGAKESPAGKSAA